MALRASPKQCPAGFDARPLPTTLTSSGWLAHSLWVANHSPLSRRNPRRGVEATLESLYDGTQSVRGNQLHPRAHGRTGPLQHLNVQKPAFLATLPCMRIPPLQSTLYGGVLRDCWDCLPSVNHRYGGSAYLVLVGRAGVVPRYHSLRFALWWPSL